MAGEWIPGKARKLVGSYFPGQWDEKQVDVLEGHCPAAHMHGKSSAPTDFRIFLGYGPQGQAPGGYCLHQSCKGQIEEMNRQFREALFARDSDLDGSRGVARPQEEGVVKRAPRQKESWVPDYSEEKLKAVTLSAPEVNERWFEERSPVDVRGVGPAEFIEHLYEPGERVLVFTDFKSQGDYLWEVGKGGYRMAEKPGVKAVRSKLPTDGGADGVWFLNNPVDGQWHGNPRRGGKPSRRSQEAVTGWRHLLLESDEAPGELWLKLLAVCGLPIVAIYSSGGRSWHALVRETEVSFAEFSEKLREYKKRLPLLGADPAAITPVRLTRLPGCTRKGKMQRLIFLNPKACSDVSAPIREMSALRKI